MTTLESPPTTESAQELDTRRAEAAGLERGHAWVLREGSRCSYVERYECARCYTLGYAVWTSRGRRALTPFQFRTVLVPRWFRGRRTMVCQHERDRWRRRR